MNDRRLRLPAVAILLLAAWTGCSRPVDSETAAAFRQAQETFDAARQPADFLRAAAQYQAIVQRGTVSGALFYNQGNALLQAGQRGRAIAAYRQAQRYRPRDPYLDANLRLALGGQPAASPPLVERVLFWQNWLSYPEKFALLAAAAGVTLLAGCVALARRRRWVWNAVAALVVLTLLAAGSAAYDWHRFDRVEHGVTIAAETVARKGNSASYEPAVDGPLAEGTEFVVRGRRGTWLHVELAGGVDGWIPADHAVVYY